MTFNLFGLDAFIAERYFGFWFFSIKGDDEFHKSLLGFYYSNGVFYLDFLFMEFIR